MKRKYNKLIYHVDNRIYKTISKSGSVISIFEYISPYRDSIIVYDLLVDGFAVYRENVLGELLLDNPHKAKYIIGKYTKELEKNPSKREGWIEEINEVLQTL